MKAIDLLMYVLVVVGGLVWGVIGAFDYNIVDGLFGEGSVLSRVVYVLVGIAAVYVLVQLVSGKKTHVTEE